MEYRTANEMYKKVYQAIGAKITKVTQQGRGESQRMLEDLGVSEEDIKQLAHYHHDAQHESYLTSLPIRALVAVAGGDHEYLRGYDPPQLCQVRDGLIDALVDLALPWMFDNYEIVVEATAECDTGNEVEEVPRPPPSLPPLLSDS